MAIQLPNSLYQAGNVKFDSTPTVNFYRQIEAERRAKQDAIDDYMRGLRSKVTPAGMRTVDLPAFDKMRKDWQTFGITNRDKIARNPQLRAQFESMAQDLLTFAEESKAAEAEKKPFIELFTDPNKRSKVRPEAFTMLSEHDKPLYSTDESGNLIRDYNRKKLDYASPLFKDPEFDFAKEYKTWEGGMKPSEVIELDKPYTDKQTGLIFYPSKERYNKEQVAQIGRSAMRGIKDDEEKFNYYSNRLAAITQKEYEQLDSVYQKYFGEPMGKSPERLAAAEAAIAAEQSVRDLKPVSKLDYERRQADTINKIYLNDSLIRGRKSGAATTEVEEGNEFDRIKPEKRWLGSGYKSLKPNEIPERTKAVLKAAGVDIEGAIKFDVEVDGDGNVQSITPYFQYDKEGKDIRKAGKITRQDMYDAQLKYNSEPQKSEQPSFGEPPVRTPKDIKQTKIQSRKKVSW